MLYDIGKLLKKKRKEKGLTLEQAGKLIGVSKVTYRDYELNNIKSARMDKMKAIADFLELSPEDLFNNEKLEEISKKDLKYKGEKNEKITCSLARFDDGPHTYPCFL